jgi:uncharacterized membrane protein YjfL (UPF0719 family)
VLLLQLATALALLALGVACYTAITPFHEWRLGRVDNQRSQTMAQARWIMARKLRAVFS